MNTFTKMWGVVTPKEAAEKIAQQRAEAGITDPKNLEEQAISLIGTDIYTKLIKGYTEKQWGRSCKELPAFIIKRLPVRYTFDNNYFNDRYQGIPVGGYNKLIEGLLAGIEVRTGVDYLKCRDEYKKYCKKRLSIPAPLTNTLVTNWAPWNTAACVLRRNASKKKIIRV